MGQGRTVRVRRLLLLREDGAEYDWEPDAWVVIAAPVPGCNGWLNLQFYWKSSFAEEYANWAHFYG